MCNTTFERQQFRRSLYASVYSYSGDRERCLQAFKHKFGLLWPWSLTSWHPSRSFMPLPWGGGHLCQSALKSVHSFLSFHLFLICHWCATARLACLLLINAFNYSSVHKLVTDGRTDGRRYRSRLAGLKYSTYTVRHNYRPLTLNVLLDHCSPTPNTLRHTERSLRHLPRSNVPRHFPPIKHPLPVTFPLG